MMQYRHSADGGSRAKGHMLCSNNKQLTEHKNHYTGKDVNENDMPLTVVLFVACNCWIGVTINFTLAVW